MNKLANRARVNVVAGGTSTITLGDPVPGFLTFTAAGVNNGDTVSYVIEDVNNTWEVGAGVYSTTGPTLTRTPLNSSAGGSALAVSVSAIVSVNALAEDFAGLASDISTLQSGKMAKSANLSDLANPATARTNLGVINQSNSAPAITVYKTGSGTYTVPTGAKWLRVRMVGAGGGGAGGGTGSPGNGGNGGNTTFGSSFLTANGGSGGNIAQSPGFGQAAAGGAFTINAGASGLGVSGGQGHGVAPTNANGFSPGAMGGASALGGAGAGAAGNAGGAGAANTGAGGGGGGIDATGQSPGGGGGAGGFIDAIIPSPSASYSYAIGAAGTAGAAGTNGFAGGAGAAGQIIVEAHFNF